MTPLFGQSVTTGSGLKLVWKNSTPKRSKRKFRAALRVVARGPIVRKVA